MPVGSKHRLNLLRPLIDGLIPRQPCLLTKARHRLDQLIDLRIQQRLTVAGLNRFELGRSRGTIPILNRDRIRRSMDRQPQIIDLPADDEIQWIDHRLIQQRVAVARRAVVFRDHILPVAASDEIRVVAQATPKRVVAGSTRQLVCCRISRQCIREAIACSITGGDSCQREVLQVGAKGPGDIALDRVGTLIRIFNDRIAGTGDIGIVAETTRENIRGTVAAEHVVEGIPDAADRCSTQQGQIFQVGAQRPAHITLNGVGPPQFGRARD